MPIHLECQGESQHPVQQYEPMTKTLTRMCLSWRFSLDSARVVLPHRGPFLRVGLNEPSSLDSPVHTVLEGLHWDVW